MVFFVNLQQCLVHREAVGRDSELCSLLLIEKLLIASGAHIEHGISLVVRIFRNFIITMLTVQLAFLGFAGHRVNPHADAVFTEAVSTRYQDSWFVFKTIEGFEAVRAVHYQTKYLNSL